MFEVDDHEGFPEREARVLEFWRREQVFQKSLDATKHGPLFSFYDGPPFATGLPHYGHLLQGTIKDAIPRFWTMRGYHVPRRFGWDCHGLPVENEIEKGHNLSGAPEIERFGIAAFNEACRSIVLRYTGEWEKTVTRMGRWVDFSKTYHTMDKTFMESVWWVFAELYKKGLVYEGLKVMPFSAKLGTPLSNFEANLNYREVDDPSVTVAFALKDDPEVAFAVWTTTPWSLPADLAVAVHPELDYVKVRDQKTGRVFILAEARAQVVFPEVEVLEKFKGRTLDGVTYVPPFSYFASEAKVLLDTFVTIEEGTGVVHLAPAFGEADFFACQKAGIEPVCPVDSSGRFTQEVPDYAGMFVKDADKEIIRRLKREGKVIAHATIRHRYPFCWRSDTPLLYKAVTTWFVAVETIKDKLLRANEKIHWVPGHIKEGRFGKWLENARDWAISRNRYWGTPIPLWRSDDGQIRVIGSVKELEEKSGKKILDLHRHFIDDITFTENGKTFRRIPEVFDCWFESGSMPYAQNHFPFEHEEEVLNGFPADFIGEGQDQTRCWFYTLTILAAALFDKPAFKNCVVTGIVLAEDGKKMSKRLKNYPDPHAVIDRFGADAIRLYLLNSPAVFAEDLKFSAKGVELVLRQVLIPLWNAYLFFATYAKIYTFKPQGTKPKDDIDRWIISELHKLVATVTAAMEAYELQQAVEPLLGFIEKLTDWYIRRSRARFWEGDDKAAFETLYLVLKTVCQLTAPFIPFLSEAIYLNLRLPEDPISVHLCRFPESAAPLRDETLEQEMALVQEVASLGHALRKEHKLKVRQPLKLAHIVYADKEKLAALKRQQALIADELNVKAVEFHSNESQFVTVRVKPNFRTLGKKVGSLMNAVHTAIENLPPEAVTSATITVDGRTITLTPEDVVTTREVKAGVVAKTGSDVTIALETELTEELILEGLARELVSRINGLRRERNFDVTGRIDVTIHTSDFVRQAFEAHRDYVCHETLAIGFEFVEALDGEVVDIGGYTTAIQLQKVIHQTGGET